MYKILLLNTDNTYSYYKVPSTSDEDVMEDFDVDTLSDLEEECINLLYSYTASQIVPVADVKYRVDLLWNNPDSANSYFPGLPVPGTTSPDPSGKNVKLKLLIKQGDNIYNFHKIKTEIMETTRAGLSVGTGRYNMSDYEATNFTSLEATSLELLKTYPYTYITSVMAIEFIIDLLWTNIDGLSVAMQQQDYDVATDAQVLNAINSIR